MKRALIASATAAFALSGAALMASPAEAPVVTGGLVNVTVVVDDITILDVNLAVPVALRLAAQVCGNSIGVIAQDLRADGTCTNTFNG